LLKRQISSFLQLGVMLFKISLRIVEGGGEV